MRIKEEVSDVRVSGYRWVFQQMEDAYILTDSNYCYLDSNESAKKMFPELNEMHDGDKISDDMYGLFISKENSCWLGDKFYEKKVTEITHDGIVMGYGMLLDDDTDQAEIIELLNNYNSRLQSEVAAKTEHIQKVQDSIITGLASVVESRDNSTGGHIVRTSKVVRIFSKRLMEHSDELGITHEFLKNVEKAAPMHDIGKIAVDDEVLRKPGRFTAEEYAEMKKHAPEGAKMLKKILREVDDEKFVEIAVNVARYHHERWDGKGYPEGIKAEDIPLESRIMALADVFDALVSKRCYKESYTYDKAFEIISDGLGTQFDPFLGRIFTQCRPELEKLYNELE